MQIKKQNFLFLLAAVTSLVVIFNLLYQNNIRTTSPIKRQTPNVIPPVNKPTSKIDSSHYITPTPQPPKTIIKIPGWNTYNNSVHKYTVQYPSDWSINTTRADVVEDREAGCCDTAILEIFKDDAKWDFRINQLYTGFDAPDECQPSPDKCENTHTPISVMGYSLERTVVRQLPSHKFVEAYISTPGGDYSQGEYGHPGFGQFGFDDPTTPSYSHRIKYFINYSGSDAENYLDHLDRISESLQAIE